MAQLTVHIGKIADHRYTGHRSNNVVAFAGGSRNTEPASPPRDDLLAFCLLQEAQKGIQTLRHQSQMNPQPVRQELTGDLNPHSTT